MTKARGLLYAFLAYACWGLLSPIGKHLLSDFTPLWLNAVRFLAAATVLLPALGPRASYASLRLAGHRPILVANLLANLSLTFFLYALPRLPATYATLGFYTAPLWTAGLAALLVGERVGRWFAPAAAGLLVGGYLALFGWAAPASGVDAFGMALAVGSAIVWALYTVQLRKAAPALELKPLMGASFLVGAAWYLVLAILFEPAPHPDPTAWAWMTLYVAVPTLASFLLFNAAMRLAPAGEANLFVGAELAFTALFAYLLFGDALGPWQIAGLGVVLASVSAYLWSQTKAPPTQG